MIQLELTDIKNDRLSVRWTENNKGTGSGAAADLLYRLFWSDRFSRTMNYKCIYEGSDTCFTLLKATHIPHYLRVEAWQAGTKLDESSLLKTPVKNILQEQLEKLSRGLIAVAVENGVFLSWRMLLEEVSGFTETGMSGTDYAVYKNGRRLTLVTDSTNYLDPEGTLQDTYSVAAVKSRNIEADTTVAAAGVITNLAGTAADHCSTGGCLSGMPGSSAEEAPCGPVRVIPKKYLEIPLQIPEGGITPAGEAYTYSANDMSVGDADGDGEYEFYVKWDPSNSHDVIGKGYTGSCLIDCYKLSGRLLWRLDLGVISGRAHITPSLSSTILTETEGPSFP